MKFSLKQSFNALHISRQRTSPFSAWAWLIIVFCIVNVIQLAFVIHAVMDMTYGETLAEGGVQVPPVETVERGRLEETIADFTARQTRFESLKSSYVAPQDPSL
jgi:hypothetical protein